MSTIMKALRRLEQEKNAQTDRPLGEAVANIHSPSPARRRGLSWLVAGGSLAGVLALGAIAFLVTRPGGDAEPGDLAALAESPPAAAAAQRANDAEAANARRTRPDLAERRARAEERRARAVELRGEPIPGDSASAKALSPAALVSDVEVVERIRPAPSDADSAPVIPMPAAERRPGAARAVPGAKPHRPADRAMAAAARRRSAQQPAPSTALPPDHEPEPPTATAASSGSAPAPPPTTAASQSPAPEQPSSPVAPDPPQPQLASSVAVPPGSEREETAAAEPEPEHGTRSTAAAAQQEATPRPPVVAEEPEPVQVAVTVPAPEPEPAPRAAPAPEPEPAPRAEPARPTAAKPASILRSPVPTVYVERTIWHPVAERRVAVVEMEGREELLELREGDAVGPLVVGRIEPSGVLFQHDGVELRRRVGAR